MPAFVDDMLKKFSISPADSVKTPTTANFLKESESALPLVDKSRYLSGVMSLNYLSIIRPDIKFPIVYLSTVTQPNTSHMDKLLRVMKYVAGTKDRGLLLAPKDYRLFIHADASYAIHPDVRSRGGIVASLGPGLSCPILMESFKIKSVVTSSTEAELVVLNDAVKFAAWWTRVLAFLGIRSGPVTIYQDNKSHTHR